MPVNRNALIRYRTIDSCLRNRMKKWNLEELIDACSEALYEYEGIDKGVSKRTIQMDLQMMRSDKLGYNAPIVVVDKKYYTYENPDYSITNIPLREEDLDKLTEISQILHQFKGFKHFEDLSSMVSRLEDKIYSAKTQQEPIIDFEKNEHLKGLEHIDTLYQAIQQKRTVKLLYQSFKARDAHEFVLHPYLLKEYRNRWFVLGFHNKKKTVLLCALDRIVEVTHLHSFGFHKPEFDIHSYFKDVVGVTVNQGTSTESVSLFVDRKNAPYVLTKPIHPSQKLVETNHHGSIISLQVKLNFELEREILGFGPSIRVLEPQSLKRRIHGLLNDASESYLSEIDPKHLKKAKARLKNSGEAILGQVYTDKETRKMKHLIATYLKSDSDDDQDQRATLSIRELLHRVPQLKPLIYNENLSLIIKQLLPSARLTKAIYFDKPHLSNWFVSWHQDVAINVKERVESSGYSNWVKRDRYYTVQPPVDILHQTLAIRIHLDDSNLTNGTLQVIPGSHRKKLSQEEIQTITSNTSPSIREVKKGGIHLMHPLLLHASSRSRSQRHRRVLHLEFCSQELAKNLVWSESENLDS